MTGDLKHECAAIAAEVAQNCGSVPQLTFPHIYLGVQRIVGEIYANRKNRHTALLPDGDDPLDEIVRLRASGSVGWRPISTVPMDGKPVLGWCVHDADDYYEGESGRLTIYGAHCEGVSHVPDGAHVLEWGGAFDDSTWESPGSSLPDWWFRSGSDFEEVANPTHWMPIAEVTR